MERTLRMYQVDAFSKQLFGGNPAAVCVLERWLDADLMQQLAMENNLSETAFVVPVENRFEIRWFTPAIEVALCGHATLASAHVLFTHEGFDKEEIHFHSMHSGDLFVRKEGHFLTLNFPQDKSAEVELPASIAKSFSLQAKACFKGKTDYMLVFESEEEIHKANPNFRSLAESGARGIIITAPGDQVDFVSRFFAPGSGIDEDPVTGSAHTTLTPYWSQRLGKKVLTAKQVSARGGELLCTQKGDRVLISGQAITYMIGECRY